MIPMSGVTRMLLGVFVALSLVAGGLVVTGTHHAEARVCLTSRCDWDYLPPAR